MRPRIYIACPISTGNLADNVNAASAAFLALVQAGFAPFCPAWSVYSGFAHGTMMEDNCIGFGSPAGMEGMSHEIWLEVDLAWVEASDLVLRLPGASVGADREVAHARKNGVPVVFSVQEAVDLAVIAGCREIVSRLTPARGELLRYDGFCPDCAAWYRRADYAACPRCHPSD